MADSEQNRFLPGAAASEAAFARYGSALRRYLVRRLRAPAEAGDLAQEVLARFLRKKDRPEVIRKPLAFLFGIASNVVREQLEAQRTELVDFDSEQADEIAERYEPEAADALAYQVGLRKDLARALEALPPNHLMALMLMKGEGLSLAEAAERTGFAEGTLNVYLVEARWKLKKILQDYSRTKDSTP